MVWTNQVRNRIKKMKRKRNLRYSQAKDSLYKQLIKEPKKGNIVLHHLILRKHPIKF